MSDKTHQYLLFLLIIVQVYFMNSLTMCHMDVKTKTILQTINDQCLPKNTNDKK